MKTFYAVCIAVVLVLIIVTMTIRRDSTSFFGIADAKEMIVNAETAVEIGVIRVVPGQAVHAGDTLIELSSPELNLRISEISHQLDELKSRKSAHVNMSRSEMRQLRSQQEARVTEIKSQIQQLEAQYETNRQLMNELRSIKKDNAGGAENRDTQNPTAIKINNLKLELTRLQDSSSIMMDQLHDQLSYSGNPMQEQIKQLEDELRLLNEGKRKLHMVAMADGIVGAVNFKEGEKVASFTTIATLHSQFPSFVQGYIHENAYSQVAVGQIVNVSSLANKQTQVTGEVVGVGARIVEYPVRLRKTPDMLMWGREVMIKIPMGNKFLLGEKVMITLKQPSKPPQPHSRQLAVGKAYAAEAPQTRAPFVNHPPLLKDITFSVDMKNRPAIEASGALFIADLDKYLIISDDTENKKPTLFLMNAAGAIEKEATIAGLDAINDMESVAPGDGKVIYILSSQSYTKKGALPASRRLFIRVLRDADHFTLTGKIALVDLLQKAAQKDTAAEWARFITTAIADSTMDIEGLAFRQGSVFLGFKDPKIDGHAVILAITGIDAVFDKQDLPAAGVRLWRKLDLKDAPTGAPCGISDLVFYGDLLYGLATAERGEQNLGLLWCCQNDTAQPQIRQRFDGEKPEGIAIDTSRREMLITFDNGSKRPSQLLTLKVDR
jgi:multidrug resistance efflux pump